MNQLKPSAIFEDCNIFMLGGTGFLGKVALSMLLTRFPQVGRIYMMVRASARAESESRFWDVILSSPAFDPMRRQYGSELHDFLREKLVIVNGDTTSGNLGLAEEEAERIASDIHVLLNCSGRVTFNPPLEIQGIVLTMVDRRNNLSEMVAKDVRAHLGSKVYDTVIPRNVRVSEAPSHGKPVLLYDVRCAGAQAYIHLASELLRRERKTPLRPALVS